MNETTVGAEHGSASTPSRRRAARNFCGAVFNDLFRRLATVDVHRRAPTMLPVMMSSLSASPLHLRRRASSAPCWPHPRIGRPGAAPVLRPRSTRTARHAREMLDDARRERRRRNPPCAAATHAHCKLARPRRSPSRRSGRRARLAAATRSPTISPSSRSWPAHRRHALTRSRSFDLRHSA